MAEGAHGTEVAGTGGPLRLRTATRDDLALLRRWDEAPHVIVSDPHDDWQKHEPAASVSDLVTRIERTP